MKYLFLILAVIAVSCNKKTIKPPVVDTVPVVVNTTVPPDTGTIPFIIPDVVKPPVIMPKERDIIDTIYFDFDSDLLRSDEVLKLKRIAGDLKSGKFAMLRLTGGACPIGDELYNYRLSLRRSEAVRKFLGVFSGIKYYIYGKGETDLVTKVESDYWRNRNCIVTTK